METVFQRRRLWLRVAFLVLLVGLWLGAFWLYLRPARLDSCFWPESALPIHSLTPMNAINLDGLARLNSLVGLYGSFSPTDYLFAWDYHRPSYYIGAGPWLYDMKHGTCYRLESYNSRFADFVGFSASGEYYLVNEGGCSSGSTDGSCYALRRTSDHRLVKRIRAIYNPARLMRLPEGEALVYTDAQTGQRHALQLATMQWIDLDPEDPRLRAQLFSADYRYFTVLPEEDEAAPNRSSGSNATVNLCETNSGRCIELSRPCPENSCRLIYVIFSPDTRWLAVSNGWENRLWVWNVEDWPPRFSLEAQAQSSFSFHHTFAFLPGGTNVVLGNRIWSLESGRIITDLGDSYFRALSPDGELLVSGRDRTVSFWETRDYRKLFTLDVPGYPIRDVQFSPDQKLLAVFTDEYSNFVRSGWIEIWGIPERLPTTPKG